MPSALTPKQAWEGKWLKIIIVGKKTLNSPTMKMEVAVFIEEIVEAGSLFDIYQGCLNEVKKDIPIPADLVNTMAFSFSDQEPIIK